MLRLATLWYHYHNTVMNTVTVCSSQYGINYYLRTGCYVAQFLLRMQSLIEKKVKEFVLKSCSSGGNQGKYFAHRILHDGFSLNDYANEVIEDIEKKGRNRYPHRTETEDGLHFRCVPVQFNICYVYDERFLFNNRCHYGGRSKGVRKPNAGCCAYLSFRLSYCSVDNKSYPVAICRHSDKHNGHSDLLDDKDELRKQPHHPTLLAFIYGLLENGAIPSAIYTAARNWAKQRGFEDATDRRYNPTLDDINNIRAKYLTEKGLRYFISHII